MIRRLLRRHLSIIYDSNCVIYQCFKTVEEGINGQEVVIDEPPFTDIVKQITEYIKECDKKIYVFDLAWKCEIENKDGLTNLVNKRLLDDELRMSLGLRRGEKFPPLIQLKVTKNLIKKVRRLKHEVWFIVDETYRAPDSKLNALTEFLRTKYQSLPNTDPFIRYNSFPNYIDMSLILYSKHKEFPLISNDRHIILFRDDLISNQYTHKIIPLMDFEEKV